VDHAVMNLDGKLALVTGAGSGIGRATATAFARAGAHLVVCDVDAARVRDVAAELGDRCVLARALDVGDREAMATLADEVHALQPALDVLVNNAGVAVGGGILDTPLESWDWLLRVNQMGVIHGCHFFAPAMAARRSGHIVNISSMFGYFAPPGVVAYVASKFSVLGMSLSMRSELAPHGVGVTAICPGMIATNIIHGSRMTPTMGGIRDKVAETFAKRGAPPAKVAAAIVDAVKKDRAVVPVAPEAWAMWGLMRAMPSVAVKLGTRMQGAWQSGKRI
jgi:NAD(P)-dependent dehydrogenase (short-subunit alcohol dehydrogenase family)